MNTKKKSSICFAVLLGTVSVTAIAQGQQMDEETLLKRIAVICKNRDYPFITPFARLPENARERALEGGLSPEWMTETLESMVLKNLPTLEEVAKSFDPAVDGWPDAHRIASSRVIYPIFMLTEFPGPNTLDLLKRCISSIDYATRDRALDAYIAIKGGDSVPFLRELLARKAINNAALSQRLKYAVIPGLKNADKQDDLDKFYAFMLEELQTEHEWFAVYSLERVLCATLDGFPQSIQRGQAMQRFANTPDMSEWDRRLYHRIQAEIDAVPADQRVDLSKRFKLAEPPKENLGVFAIPALGQQMDEEALQKRIVNICREYNLPVDARERALEGGLSPEQVRKTLERMIRENLPVLAKIRKREGDYFMSDGLPADYRAACNKVTSAILMLRHFSDSKTLALMRECASFEDYSVRDCAIGTYITVAGGDSMLFLREIIAKGENRTRICRLLGSFIPFLIEKHQNDDMEKVHAFLLDMLQEEQSWYGVEIIDNILRPTLAGYPQSIQRRQAVQRLLGIPIGGKALERFNVVKAEVDAVPADQRVDLSKRFKLAEPPKGEN